MEEQLCGNPWLLNETPITNQHRLDVIKEHLDLLIAEKGEYIAIREMRKHICWYVKKLANASQLKQEVTRLETKAEVIKCLNEYFLSL